MTEKFRGERTLVIQGILPDLSEMIGGGLITLEKAHVILYRPGPS